METESSSQQELKERRCAKCGNVLVNDTYGDNCEDCFNFDRPFAYNSGFGDGGKQKKDLANSYQRRKGATKGEQ